jgi:hypothetical protein
MVCFQTKNPNLDKFWRALEWKMRVHFISHWGYFTVIGDILWPFGNVVEIWYSFPPFGIKIWQPCRVGHLSRRKSQKKAFTRPKQQKKKSKASQESPSKVGAHTVPSSRCYAMTYRLFFHLMLACEKHLYFYCFSNNPIKTCGRCYDHNFL